VPASSHDTRSLAAQTSARQISSPVVRHVRRCTRTGCGQSAVATLTYIYSDSTAVVGPLAAFAEPHSYDLCEEHAVRLTVPRGWEVVRHAGEFPSPLPHADDLEALADAVREAARVEVPRRAPSPDDTGLTGRRGHLRVVPPPV
jgi:hypothetical protein